MGASGRGAGWISRPLMKENVCLCVQRNTAWMARLPGSDAFIFAIATKERVLQFCRLSLTLQIKLDCFNQSVLFVVLHIYCQTWSLGQVKALKFKPGQSITHCKRLHSLWDSVCLRDFMTLYSKDRITLLKNSWLLSGSKHSKHFSVFPD